MRAISSKCGAYFHTVRGRRNGHRSDSQPLLSIYDSFRFHDPFGNKRECVAFQVTAFPLVFTARAPELPNPHFIVSPEHRLQLRPMLESYSRLHHEFLLMSAPDGTDIGWSMGEAEDLVTFYMRNTGILPAYQSHGLYTAFLEHFIKFAKEIGYERISSHHKATNRKILIIKLKQGFDIAGFELTENWGPLIKVVKHLHPGRHRSFVSQFGDPEHLSSDRS